jgi:hypothetical protein
MIVYENFWSLPFVVAARKAGGQLVGQGHIPTQALVAAPTRSSLTERKVMPGLLRGVARTAVVASTARCEQSGFAVRPIGGPKTINPVRATHAEPQYANWYAQPVPATGRRHVRSLEKWDSSRLRHPHRG